MTRITRLVVITQKNQELNKYKDRINLSYTNKQSIIKYKFSKYCKYSI